jgi:hypothetical protein
MVIDEAVSMEADLAQAKAALTVAREALEKIMDAEVSSCQSAPRLNPRDIARAALAAMDEEKP